MSVVLSQAPAPVAFSGNQLKVAFTCSGMNAANPVKAVNRIDVEGSAIALQTLQFNYGAKAVTLTAAAVPDDSGNEFPTSANSAASLVESITGNFTLTNDFDIRVQDNTTILLTAKTASFGFDFAPYPNAPFDVRNITPGKPGTVRSNYAIFFRLYCQNAAHTSFEKIYENRIQVTYGSSTAEINLGDKLHDYISEEIRRNLPDIPTDGPMICKKSCRKYYFEYAESYGEPLAIKRLYKSPEYTVLHGGLSSVGESSKSLLSILAPDTVPAHDQFLKQGPKELSTRADQPQYLYFLNTRDAVTVTLNCKYYFTDGSIAAVTLGNVALAKYEKAGFNIRFDKIFIPEDYPVKKVKKYEVWLSTITGTVISESRFYALDDQYRKHFKYFLNWSSFGTMDSRMFYGKGSVEFDLVQAEADKVSNNPLSLTQGTSLVYNISIQTKFSITTGFIANKALLFLNRDFFLSPLKYVLSTGQMLPVKVTTKTIAEFEDGNDLYAQKFEYQLLFEDAAYTEGDVEQPASPPERVTGQIYFGPSASKPLTDIDILSLPNSISPEVYLIPLYTGSNRFFTIAFPTGKRLGNAFDNTSQENVTSEYLPVSISIDNNPYRVYTMEMAIAYSSNHDHILTAVNV